MRRVLKAVLLFYVFIILCTEKSTAESNIRINIKPQNIYQGSCFAVEITSSKEISSVYGTFLNKSINFYNIYKDGNNFKAWVGVPIEEATGTKNINLNIFVGKKRSYITKELNIVKKNFPVERINIPEGKTSLLTSKALERESQIIGGCFKYKTKDKFFNGKFVIPAKGKVTSQFGLRRIYSGSSASWPHKGIDIGGYGGEKIFASNSGRVVLSSSFKAHGNTIIIDHGLGILSIYCHLKQRNVKKGDIVKKGGVVGILGKSGIATGEHLHFGISVNDVRVNPVQFINGDVTI